MGQSSTRNWTAGFRPCFYLPGQPIYVPIFDQPYEAASIWGASEIGAVTAPGAKLRAVAEGLPGQGEGGDRRQPRPQLPRGDKRVKREKEKFSAAM